jgi:hypothetical protein
VGKYCIHFHGLYTGNTVSLHTNGRNRQALFNGLARSSAPLGKISNWKLSLQKERGRTALEIERNIDRGVLQNSSEPKSVCAFAKTINTHAIGHH